MTEELTGVDLRGRDLRGTMLRHQRLDEADLRGVNLSDTTFAAVRLDGAFLIDADLRGATLGMSQDRLVVTVRGADATGADLGGAHICGDIRRAVFRPADLRGADLSHTVAVHPHPQNAGEDELSSESARAWRAPPETWAPPTSSGFRCCEGDSRGGRSGADVIRFG